MLRSESECENVQDEMKPDDIFEFLVASRINKNRNTNYWTYCGIRIPMSIRAVPSRDNINTHYQDGLSTQAGGFAKPLSVWEYRMKYGEIRSDGILHWKTAKRLPQRPDIETGNVEDKNKNKDIDDEDDEGATALSPLYRRWLEFYYFGKIW